MGYFQNNPCFGSVLCYTDSRVKYNIIAQGHKELFMLILLLRFSNKKCYRRIHV